MLVEMLKWSILGLWKGDLHSVYVLLVEMLKLSEAAELLDRQQVTPSFSAHWISAVRGRLGGGPTPFQTPK